MSTLIAWLHLNRRPLVTAVLDETEADAGKRAVYDFENFTDGHRCTKFSVNFSVGGDSFLEMSAGV